MTEPMCALAADTKVETPEGSLTVRSVAGKSVAVFTRDPAGGVRFRLMENVRKVAEQQPVLKITLDNGFFFRVAGYQVLFKKGMVGCRADGLRAGDALEPAFHYPAGYRFHSDADGSEQESSASLQVIGSTPDGAADLYAFRVKQTGCFFLTAGVLCKAED
jgi:hypothetical protein